MRTYCYHGRDISKIDLYLSVHPEYFVECEPVKIKRRKRVAKVKAVGWWA